MTERLSEREREIVSMLMEDSAVSVSDISTALKVSAVTVRNDLNSLAEKGFIVRTRGGAFPTFHPSILDRQREAVNEKNRIARKASDFIADGDTVMVEAGTTTAFIARYLLGKRDVHIVTNSSLLLTYGRINPSLHLTVVGGEFSPQTESFVGPICLKSLEQFHVKLAFVGTDGFSLEKGLTTHLVEGAEVVRMMAAHADRTILVADSSKFGRVGFAHVLPVTSVQAIITDTEFPEDAASEFSSQGIEVCRV